MPTTHRGQPRVKLPKAAQSAKTAKKTAKKTAAKTVEPPKLVRHNTGMPPVASGETGRRRLLSAASCTFDVLVEIVIEDEAEALLLLRVPLTLSIFLWSDQKLSPIIH